MSNAIPKSCRVCGEPTPLGKNGKPRMYCSRSCEKKFHYRNSKKTCTVDGCANTHIAKGLCSTHYAKNHRANAEKYKYTCDECGVSFNRSRPQAGERVFCGRLCQNRWLAANKVSERYRSFHRALYGDKGTDLVVYRKPRPLFLFHKVIHVRGTGAWKDTTCAWCGDNFLTKNVDVTCSEDCFVSYRRMKKREGKLSYRARKKMAYVSPVVPKLIYDRDGYKCHICGKSIDMNATAPSPLSPTIDHVIPLAAGGTHEPGNCKAAHFVCNSMKRDRPLQVVLALAE